MIAPCPSLDRRPRRRVLAALALLVAALNLLPSCDAAPTSDASVQATRGSGERSAVSLLELLPKAELSRELDRTLREITSGGHDFVATGGAWRREGEEVHAGGTPAEGELATLVRQTPAIGDGTVAADVRLLSEGEARGQAGILVRLRDASDGLAVTLDEKGVRLLRIRDGRLLQLAAADAAVGTGEWYALRVVLSGSTVAAFLGERRVLERDVPDAPADGGIGLLRSRGGGVAFRDLELTSGHVKTKVVPEFANVPPSVAPLVRSSRTRSGAAEEPWQMLVHTIELDDDFRRSLVVPPGAEIRVPLAALSRPSLHFEVGVLASSLGSGGSSRLRVGLEDASGTQVWLWLQQLSAEAHTRSWEPASVDLAPGEGRPGTLILRNESIGPGGSFVALANPVVRSYAPAPVRRRRNLVLVTVDTLRADHLGVYGYHRDTSPFLDALAARSVVVDEVIAQSSWTKTSMASLLTSTYPERNGVRGSDHVLPDDLTTLAEALEREGYFTAAVQTNPWLLPRFRMARGFAEYRWLEAAPPAARVNEQAIAILNRRRDEPWFLYLHYMDVHHPYLPPAAYQRFGTEPADLYDGEIRYVDEQLAGLHRSLADMGLLDDTLLVVTSDHGEEFGEHGGRHHGGTLYDEQLRVPLILSAPDLLPAGLRLAGPMQNLDVAPTILDLLDVAAPAGWQGRSWKERILSRTTMPPGDVEVFAQTGLNDIAPGRDLISISVGRWKLIKDRRSDWLRLFDRVADREERNDLSSVALRARADLDARCAAFLAANQRSRTATGTAPVDPAVAAQLRALGYLQEPVATPALAGPAASTRASSTGAP